MKIINGVLKNKENPKTFNIPSDIEKLELKIWDNVIIWYELIDWNIYKWERVNVKIVDIKNNEITWQIDDDIIHYKELELEYWNIINFHIDNILSIIKKNT